MEAEAERMERRRLHLPASDNTARPTERRWTGHSDQRRRCTERQERNCERRTQTMSDRADQQSAIKAALTIL